MPLVDDPRPDLEGDHELWRRVLRAAVEVSDGHDEPLGALNGLRCMGARVVEGENGLRLERGEIAEEDYVRWRETYLVPRTQQVKEALRRAKDAGI